MLGGMLPTMDISVEDEAFLLESISKHNKLILEEMDCWCEERLKEIRFLIERLRAERQEIIKKYSKVEGNQCLDFEGKSLKGLN